MTIATNRRLRLCSFLLLGLALAGVRWAGADEPAKAAELKGDLKAFQGTWVSKDDMGESTWVFKGDRVSIKTPSRAYEMTAKLDAEAKPEKQIEFTVLEDSPNAKGAKGAAIYKISGDTASICMAIGDGGRPTEFKTDFPNSVNFELKKK
jgi:uncharacterized protein (TIGR03067 family)